MNNLFQKNRDLQNIARVRTQDYRNHTATSQEENKRKGKMEKA